MLWNRILIHQKDNIQENKMGRVQIGKKQRVEVSEHDETTKAIARKVVREIVEEGFNGADVLPGVWVIEKTIRNSIVNEQPNISPDISQGEINELAKTMLSSVKSKTNVADEKVKSIETFEQQIDFPKELPTIRMGNITVVKFPEGGADAERSIKVKGYRKVGKFYRKKPDVLGKPARRTKLEMDMVKKEKALEIRRLKQRRGLLKPPPRKSIRGEVNSPFIRRGMPIPKNMGPVSPVSGNTSGFGFGGPLTRPFRPKVDLNNPKLSESVLGQIKAIKDGTLREKLSPTDFNPKDIELKAQKLSDEKLVKAFKDAGVNPTATPTKGGFLG